VIKEKRTKESLSGRAKRALEVIQEDQEKGKVRCLRGSGDGRRDG